MVHNFHKLVRELVPPVAVPFPLPGTLFSGLASGQKRLSELNWVGLLMKGAGIVAAISAFIAVSALVVGAQTIHKSWMDFTSPPAARERRLTLTAQTHRLMNLKNSTARHKTPDAIVYVPAGFDQDGPLNVLLYNHGLTNDLDEAFKIWRLDEAMQNAPPNTVMILPEWAANPSAYSSAAGPFHQPNFFRKMLGEIMAKTPQLKDKTVDDIKSVTIATFSGGFRASQTQIHRNGLEDKVRGLVLLDSLYESDFFDQWLKANIHELAAGRKFYQNFYFDTAANSMAQLRRLQKIVADAGLPQSTIHHIKDNPKEVVASDVIAKYPILYVYTTMYSQEHSAHQSAAYIYFPQALKALSLNERRLQLARREGGGANIQ